MSEANFLDKYNALRELGPAELAEIRDHYDRDQSGFIEAGPELDSFLTDMLRAGGKGEEISELMLTDFIEGILDLFDVNADGKLSKVELQELLDSDKQE